MNHKNRLRRSIVLACMMMLTLTQTYAAGTPSPGETTAVYTEVMLKRGSITENVIATGSLRFENEVILNLPEALTLQSIEVKEGESVKKGQILAHYDAQALKDSLRTAEDDLLAQNETITQLMSGQSSEDSIKTSIAGVVKKLNLEAGQLIGQTLQDKPAAIISANGLMQVNIIPSQPLSLGMEVKVKVGTQTQIGSVARLEADGSALITFPDTRAEIDELVQVTLGEFKLGEGKAQVSLPYELFTLTEGVVDSAPVKVNSVVRRNSIIYQVKNVSPSNEYLRALEDRADMYQTILLYKELIAEPAYLSPQDGIVAEVSAQVKASMQKGDELLSLFPPGSFVLDVAVDELDILSVEAGQDGTAALDALTQEEFKVKVEKIFLLGTSSGGITNYTVTLSIQGDERLRSGMNGTVTLRVGEVKDAVLVPLVALMSDRGGSYVLLKGNGTDTQGTKTYIEVGLSDANFAAVLQGLDEGDTVLVRSTALPQQTRQSAPGFMSPNSPFNPGGGKRQ